MSRRNTGEFASSFGILQLQLRTLFEGVGGEKTLALLDQVAQLGRVEQSIVLKTFTSVVTRILADERRLITNEERNLSALGDRIYSDVLEAMKTAAHEDPSDSAENAKLELVDGGKEAARPAAKGPIDLAKVRDARKRGKDRTLLN